jgi:UDP-GlcNAc:undecaprenyl-phosphate GlcNAc-1-phosphate transferase
LTTPGKDHLSHRLARKTGSTREAVLICYLLGFIGGTLATFVTQASVLEGYLVGGAVFVISLLGLWRLERKPL